MKSQQITRTIKRMVAKLSMLAKKTGKTFDKDVIHDFRITAKMLRSFLRLLSMHTGNKKMKFSGRFKRLYHIAGAIREAQLESMRMAQEQLHLQSYLDKLNKIIAARKI